MTNQQALIQQQRQALVSAQQQARGLVQAQKVPKAQLLAKQRGIAAIAKTKAAAQVRREAGRQQTVRIGQQAAQFETEVAQKAPEYAKPEFKEKAYQEARKSLQSKASSLQGRIASKTAAIRKATVSGRDEQREELEDDLHVLSKELGVYARALKGSKESVIKGHFSGQTAASATYKRESIEASHERSEARKEYRKVYKEYQKSLPPTKVSGVTEPAKITQAPGTYDPTTKSYIDPSGAGMSMEQKYVPSGTKIISPTPSFLAPPKLPWEKSTVKEVPIGRDYEGKIVYGAPGVEPYKAPSWDVPLPKGTPSVWEAVKRDVPYVPPERRAELEKAYKEMELKEWQQPSVKEFRPAVRTYPSAEIIKPVEKYVPKYDPTKDIAMKPKGVEQLGGMILRKEEVEARGISFAEPSVASRLFEEKESQKRFEQSWKEYATTVIPEEGYRVLTKEEYKTEVLPQITEQVKLEKVGGYGVLVPEKKDFFEKQKETWVVGEKLVSEKIPAFEEVVQPIATPISEFILKHKKFTPEELEKLSKVESFLGGDKWYAPGKVTEGIYESIREKPVTFGVTTVAFASITPAITAVGWGARATGVTAFLAKAPETMKVAKTLVKGGMYGLTGWYGSTIVKRVMATDNPEKAYKEYKKIVKEEGIPEGYRELEEQEFKAQYESISKGETLGRIIGGEIVPMGLGGYLGTRIIAKPRITKADIKAIEKAKPDVFVGKGVGDKFEIMSKRRTPKFEVQTIQEFEVVKETGQILRGKGTQKIIDIKTGKEVVSPESFTFFGESGKVKAFKVKETGILKVRKPIKLEAGAGRVRILTKDLKKIDKAFAGLAEQKDKFVKVITGEIPFGRYYKTDKKGMIFDKTGKPLEFSFYEDVLKAKFRPTGLGVLKLTEPKLDVKVVDMVKPSKVKPTIIDIKLPKVEPKIIDLTPPKVKLKITEIKLPKVSTKLIEIKKPVFEAPSLVGMAVEEEIISIIKPTPKPFTIKVTKPVILDVVPEPILKPTKELIIQPPIKKVEPVVTPQILKPMVELKLVERQVFEPVSIQVMKPTMVEVMKPVSITELKPVEAQLLRPAMVQVMRPAMVQVMRPAMVQRLRPVSRLAPRITPKVIVRPRPPVRPPKLVPKLPPRRTRFVKHLEKREPLKSGYGIEIKRKGKWVRIPLHKSFATKEGADAFAMAMVQREAAASYKLVKSKKSARKSFKKPSALQKFMFRPGKEAGIMVQKKLLRITTPGEVEEISLVGAEARRKKPVNVLKLKPSILKPKTKKKRKKK